MNSKTNLALLKEGRRVSKRKKFAPVQLSRKIEIYYTKELLEISRQCQIEGDQILEITRDSSRFVGDVAVGDAPAWLTAVKSVVFGGITRKVKGASDAIAKKVVTRQAKATDEALAKQIKDMTGIEAQKFIKKQKLGKIVDDSIAANVSLIKSIPIKYHERLERLVLVAVQNGKPQSWLEHQVKRLGKTTDARAKLIARDQIAKINGSVVKERHKQLGVDEYYWQTCKDERVRPKHRKREGEKFRWDSPPDGGHPSEEVNCRCGAIPVLDDA